MNRLVHAALVATVLALGAAPVRAWADDDGGDDGHDRDGGGSAGKPASGQGRGSRGRADDDVAVRLSLGDRRSGSPAAKVRVRNRGRNDQEGILVELRAGSESGELLASWTVDLRAGRTWSVRLRVAPPDGTAALVATAGLDGIEDGNPADNVSRAPLGPTGSPGGAGDAAVGSALYAARCATCHGPSAEGTASGPRIAGEPASGIAEVLREGEDGMPAFPDLRTADVRALAAFLKAPSTPAPPPSPPPPPAGTAPTWAGQVKAFVDANCAACHSGKNASAGVRLDSLAATSANAARSLAAMEAGRMPKTGPLDAASLQLLRDWIAGGRK